MSNNGPDDEVSLNLELSNTGVQGKVKGRALSIFQRWLGSALAVSIARNNRTAARERVLGALEQKALQQIGAEALESLRTNPSAVDGVVEALQLPGVTRQYENSSEVLAKALEDLRVHPPSSEETQSGSEEISPEVADRLQHYASGASTDEIRERWGRVLAAEIRRPGTFSLKVLRIIDELDDEIPALFERFAASRLDDGLVPRSLSGKLPYSDSISLVDAGLLHDPGSGGSYQLRYFAEGSESGKDAWMLLAANMCVTIPREDEFTIPNGHSEAPIVSSKGQPAVPAYLLTSAGTAIVSILPPVDTSRDYLAKLREIIPTARLWQMANGGDVWIERDALQQQPNSEGSSLPASQQGDE